MSIVLSILIAALFVIRQNIYTGLPSILHHSALPACTLVWFGLSSSQSSLKFPLCSYHPFIFIFITEVFYDVFCSFYLHFFHFLLLHHLPVMQWAHACTATGIDLIMRCTILTDLRNRPAEH